MIEAYCDESGIHGDANHCVVVGFVGSVRNWQLFERAWGKASGGVDFHGKEFFGRSKGQRVGLYAGWSDGRARRYLVDLVDVITATNFKPIGCVIDAKAFANLGVEDRRYLTGAIYDTRKNRFTSSGAPSKPFFLGFTECMRAAVDNVNKPGWKVSVVWDRQNEFAGLAKQLFETGLRIGVPPMKERLGELVFRGKDGVGGLQAADLLAHTCYKRASISVGAKEELDIATRRLRPMTHKKIRLYDEYGLRELLEHFLGDARQHWHRSS